MPKLIVGLGNIGEQYVGTRHNTGFQAVEHIAETHGAIWTEKSKFKALLAEYSTASGEKILLAKPTTFYNLSGEAVRALKDFYKLDNRDILVIHDELALPFGTLRTRIDGSDAGNNGIKSVSQHIGTNYARIRIGIANDFLQREGATDFVLGRFTSDERDRLSQLQKNSLRFAESFITNSFAIHTETVD